MTDFRHLSLCCSLAVCLSSFVSGETVSPALPEFQAFGHQGVVDDPNGYADLRNDKRADAPIVAKVKTGEPFSFVLAENDPWAKVKLASGVTGWMHYSPIKFFFRKADLPEKSDQGWAEIYESARSHGVNYYEATQGAVRGDYQALKTFFLVSSYADGAAGEEHVAIVNIVIHLLGDDALAKFLRTQPKSARKSVYSTLNEGSLDPFDSSEYLIRHFPKTAKALDLVR